ncbi:DUF6791 domain-containing protein [Demequina globuliformis]|uniref:DUF6791 domain-containing protein n=1 Tax=Demequina globuliformis TaxID=676202 RepID=UPI0009FFB362|nr:DUF6791 domain-containing protein [Demequina globuliformis]
MPTSPFAHDPHTVRLLDEGYDLSLVGGHLVVNQVPYVTKARTVAYGQLAFPVTFSGDTAVDQSGDHRIWFVGEQPHHEDGTPLGGPSPDRRVIGPGLTAQFMISLKPKRQGKYENHYDKITSYARNLGHPAIAVDSTVNLTPGAAWQEVEEGLPFIYRDSATSRAGLAELNSKFRGHTIGIVGVGGTGSYILDQVAKTWVDRIVLLDGDVLDNHNAFRAPGAADIDALRVRLNKAEYFAGLYGHMHTGITAHPVFLDEDNLQLLSDCTFVFLAAADAPAKHAIMTWLHERGIPVVTVGMGVDEEPSGLSGLVCSTMLLPEDPTPTTGSGTVPFDPDYDRNIQTAELNMLNAAYAVVQWKRYLGYYATHTPSRETIYKIYTDELRCDEDKS